MVTVEELRTQLIGLGMSEEEANSIKGKKNLVNRIEEIGVDKESQEVLEEAVVVESNGQAPQIERVVADQPGVWPVVSNEDKDEPEDTNLTMTDPGWPEFVLSHLEENEKIKGHPKADSLRRLTELLIGQVVQIRTQVPQCPSMESNGRATVIVHVTVEPYDTNLTVMQASGAADVGVNNTEQLFAKFPVATAETRAEGRAYRKLLRLINVVTAEEVVDENQIYDPDDRISSQQISMIDVMCSSVKLDIDIAKLLSQYDVEAANLENISKSKATEICKIVNSYQQTSVPEELIGYQADWRK